MPGTVSPELSPAEQPEEVIGGEPVSDAETGEKSMAEQVEALQGKGVQEGATIRIAQGDKSNEVTVVRMPRAGEDTIRFRGPAGGEQEYSVSEVWDLREAIVGQAEEGEQGLSGESGTETAGTEEQSEEVVRVAREQGQEAANSAGRAVQIADRLERGARLEDITEELGPEDPVRKEIDRARAKFEKSDLDLGFSSKAYVAEALRRMKGEVDPVPATQEEVGADRMASEEVEAEAPEDAPVAVRAEEIAGRLQGGEDLQNVKSELAPDDPVLKQIEKAERLAGSDRSSYSSAKEDVLLGLEILADRERRRLEKRKQSSEGKTL